MAAGRIVHGPGSEMKRRPARILRPLPHLMSSIPGLTRTHFAAAATPSSRPTATSPAPFPARKASGSWPHITPAMGAGFVQSTWHLEPAGKVALPASADEHVLLPRIGARRASCVEPKTDDLSAGDYVYLPPRQAAEIRGGGGRREDHRLPENLCAHAPASPPPAFLLGRADKIAGQPFLGNPARAAPGAAAGHPGVRPRREHLHLPARRHAAGSSRPT